MKKFCFRYQLTLCAATSKVSKRNSDFLDFDSNNISTSSDSEAVDSILDDFESSVEVFGTEKSIHTFSKLPEIVGSGFPYIVQIRAIVVSPREVNRNQI